VSDYVPLWKKRWGLLPAGELHPQDRCARCGDTRSPKHRTVLIDTNAIGYLCDDNCACVRRRTAQKNRAA